MPYRACVKHIRGLFSPLLSGRMFASGIRQSSKTSSDVTDARKESLCFTSGALKPGVPFSTMKPRIVSLSSVLAHTTAMRSEEHTSELQSLRHLVCRLLLEKKNKRIANIAKH